jgi:hypothetical protein
MLYWVKHLVLTGHRWLMLVILATGKAKIRSIALPSKPGQMVHNTQLQNNHSKMGWRCGSSRRTIETP